MNSVRIIRASLIGSLLAGLLLLAALACDVDWNSDKDDTDEIRCEFYDDYATVQMTDIATATKLSSEGEGQYLATLNWNIDPDLFSQLVDQQLSDVTLTLRGSITNSGDAQAIYSISLADSRYGDATLIGSITVNAGQTYSFASPDDFNEPAADVRSALEEFIVVEPHNDWDYATIGLSTAQGAIQSESFSLAISAGPMFWLSSGGCGWYNDLDLPEGTWIEDAWLNGTIDNLSQTDSVAIKIFTVYQEYDYNMPQLLDNFTIAPGQTVDLEDRSAHYGSSETYDIMDLFLYDYGVILAMVAINEAETVVHDISANVEVIYPDYEY
ncbi:MAG: hypothetical protein P9M14_02365 [Candidatus Alcyoniella australis]|nr:hypothetical protein [Candidatus Alcyoniella australis]